MGRGRGMVGWRMGEGASTSGDTVILGGGVSDQLNFEFSKNNYHIHIHMIYPLLLLN